jgi:outer membrane protein OmpA-like peptidoglycan-associated protein
MSAEEKKVVEEEGGESAPLWIISFADMISLLMAFFVMLSTCNTYDKQEQKKLEATFAATLRYSGGWLTEMPNSSMSPGLAGGDDVEDGPETRSSEETTKSGQINQTDSMRFFTDRMFLVSENLLFHSTSLGLTPQGREWLDNLAMYLSKMKGQILIAEPLGAQTRVAGPQRSLAIANYLLHKNIDADRISISTRQTSSNPEVAQNREIEIGLVEKEICP